MTHHLTLTDIPHCGWHGLHCLDPFTIVDAQQLLQVKPSSRLRPRSARVRLSQSKAHP